MIFIDTNYFLRYLLNDISEQHDEAKQLFLAGVEGKADLVTSSLVLFECAWVLRSFYGLEKADLIVTLRKILELSFIHLSERSIIADALNLFEKTNLSMEDCYNIFYAKEAGAETFKTFDKKLEKEFKK